MSFWDDRYSRDEYVFGEAPNAFLAAQGHLLPKSGKALAIADGEGRNGVWLAEQGLDVVSIDASPVGLDKAKKLAAKRRVPLQTHLLDIADYDWPKDRFDVVAGIFFQFAGPELRDEIFAGMIETLKPGGLLILQGYGPRQLEYKTGGPGILENLYTEALLAEKFAALEILHLSDEDRELAEGLTHVGRSHVVDLVGRKAG
ncbi:cyclopropane-fatty-acyl-phospholipid synthase family protein [Devosia sp.]|uniref:SAM-dependent methyltransferase n=1 Tax=Devosia sp. TaxID=1871048 RepID=UPI001B0C2728|nr:class I SAM-dependent methyltransferase [Devosia sp.]MBO9587118.1 class I SAM-dependent methyltransferase [Devosia sp.]